MGKKGTIDEMIMIFALY